MPDSSSRRRHAAVHPLTCVILTCCAPFCAWHAHAAHASTKASVLQGRRPAGTCFSFSFSGPLPGVGLARRRLATAVRHLPVLRAPHGCGGGGAGGLTMMPEGPECKRTADQLDAYCAGWSLSKVEILSGRYVTHGPPKGFAEFCSTWLPAEIEQVSCKGKFIYYLLRSKEHGQASIWSTLGMSGRWALRESDHSRVRFTLSSSGMEAAASESDKVLYYTDPRNFGTLTFSMDDSELESKLSTLGPSYLAGEVTALEFVKLARKANRRYAAVFLMDQSKTSGIGNYILSEALFRSWIDPFLRVGQIPDSKLIDLYQAIMEVITDSYASFGVSRGAKKQAPPIGMFRGLDNNAGSYSEHLQVYGRDTCPQGRRVRKEVGPHKRAIWFVDEQLTPASAANREALGLTTQANQAPHYLTVPFAEKDDAKKLGAQWDPIAKKWFVAPGKPVAAFKKWL